MKLIIQLSYIFLFFICCNTLKRGDGDLLGEYFGKGKDYEYVLMLRPDNTFYLRMKYQDANPQCEGVWQKKGSHTINLECEEVSNIAEVLSNAYLNERTYNLEVISDRKLKFNGVTLVKRKKRAY